MPKTTGCSCRSKTSNLLSRYGHDEGLLDKLGGGAWQAKKAKLKERIREVADKLIRIAAERSLAQGPDPEPPDGMWDAFSARFPYQETDDQLRAINDTLDDLASGAPMDRLICGDVGFGKTEVAMRAAFVAAMSGVQVAVIAPTTLAGPPTRTRVQRTVPGLPDRGAPIVALRFCQGRRSTRDGLARGTVDIVIGTHAVLAKVGALQEPRPAGHRRRTALRCDPQGTAETDALGHPRADADRHTDPAHAATYPDRGAGLVDHRHAAGRPAGDPHLCQRIRHDHPARGACCANITAAGSRSSSCPASAICPRWRTG